LLKLSVDNIPSMEYYWVMVWSIDFDEDFSIWFEAQDPDVQEEILASLKMLAELGPALRRPRVGNIEGSKYPQMKELVVQYKGDPWRILFAFDPERHAILLVGGDKTGNSRWYKIHIPIADARFDKHLLELKAKETERNALAKKENRK
jgi:hypothetical protein